MGTFRRGNGGRWAWAAAGVLPPFLPTGVQAHTTFQGLGEFGSGFLHPLTTPPHLLVILGLGLLLGQQVPLRLARPVAAYGGLAAVGLLATASGYHAGVPQAILVMIGLCAGMLVVVAAPLPAFVRPVLGGVAALALGLDSGVDPGTPGVAAAKTLFATGVSLVLWVVNVAFYVSLLPPRQWVQTGVRVAGSWIVAIGFLMLAFALKR